MNIFQNENLQSEEMKVKIDLATYAIKADLGGVDTSKFVKKIDLASL